MRNRGIYWVGEDRSRGERRMKGGVGKNIGRGRGEGRNILVPGVVGRGDMKGGGRRVGF